MRRWILAAAAVVSVGGPLPALAGVRPKAPAPAASEDAFQMALAEAGAALRNGDMEQARKVLQRAWRSPGFATAPADLRHDLLLALTGLAVEAKAWADAKEAIAAATAMPEATGDDWMARWEVAARAGDKAEAVASLTTLAERFPNSLSDLDDDTVDYWINEASRQPQGEAVHFRLVDAVAKGGWTPADPFVDLSDMRRRYALGLLTRGRVAEAEREAAKVTFGEAIMLMRADKRFDALVGTGPQRFVVKTASQARLKAIEALLKTDTRRLSGPIAQAETLIALNRADEALAVLDAAIARANADPKAFDDQSTKLSWAHNTRQAALNWLGRREEALEALAAGARVPERGQPNINQTLNLAVAQVSANQPRAALATAASARMDLMSPYGKAVMLKAKTCAAATAGEPALALAARRELEALGDAAKGNSLDALLCVGDLDAAAKLVIARLADAESRSPILLELQRTPPSPHPTAYGLSQEAKLEQLRQRPDVLAALEPIGRIVRYAPADLW